MPSPSARVELNEIIGRRDRGHKVAGMRVLECVRPSPARRVAGTRRARTNAVGVPNEGSARARLPRRPAAETSLERAERIADAYGLVLVLIFTTFIVTVTLPPEGWIGRVAASAVAGATAVIALTSSDVRLERVRLAILVAAVAVVASALARLFARDVLMGIAFLIDSLLLTIAAVTILRRVVHAAEVDFRTILG